MSKIAYKLILSTLALAVVFVAIHFLTKTPVTLEDGTFELVIETSEGLIVFDQELTFLKGDTLFLVLNNHFNLTCANQFYKEDKSCSHTFNVMGVTNKVLLGISNDQFDISTDWNNTFIRIDIEKDNVFIPATRGVDDIALTEGIRIRLIVVKAW